MIYCKKIECIDNVAGMKQLPDGCIPLTVTSPPWDNLREGNGYDAKFDFPAVAEQLWRITCDGGVVCWDVQDQTLDNGDSGTSFRQALYFKEIGFRLHETLIMLPCSYNTAQPRRNGRPPQFVFVLSKGQPRYVNPIKDVPNAEAGRIKKFCNRDVDGSRERRGTWRIRKFRKRGHVWGLATGFHTAKEKYASEHPALMTEAQAYGLIVTYSKPLDLVFDPFAGAGTTCKMAALNNRYYLGFERNPRFVEIARQRLLDNSPDGSAFVHPSSLSA